MKSLLIACVLTALSIGCGEVGTATIPRPTVTACTPGKTSACACVGGGLVGSQTCEPDGSRYATCVCLPPAVADAASSDALDATSDVIVDAVRAETHVMVTCSPPREGAVLTNSGDANVRGMSVQVDGDRDVELRRLTARLAWSGVGFPGHIRSRQGAPYFERLVARDLDTTDVIMGPASFGVTSDRQSGDALLSRRSVIRHGTRRLLAFDVGIVAQKTDYHDFIGGFYSLEFGERTRQIFVGDDLAFVDTGTAVPPEAITYGASCFDAPSEHDFQVVARFGDLIADLDERIQSTNTTVSLLGIPTAGLASLGVVVVNDGHQSANMSQMVVEGIARANGVFEIPLGDVVTSCSLLDVDGRSLGTAIRSGVRFEFRSIRGTVPGLSSARFVLYCTYVAPPADLVRSLMISTVEVRFGALSDSFRVSTEGDAGRIRGTLRLEANHLSVTMPAVTVTLHPTP